jgi:Zn-dependent M28 family amino/carboxypeptidase
MCRSEKIYSPPDKRKRNPLVKPIMGKLEKKTEILDQRISSLLEKVSPENIESNLNKLSNFHTRHSKSIHINEASNWILSELKGLGYKDVTYYKFNETIDNEEFELKNIVCEKKGLDDKVIIICAHYDSRMQNLKDSSSRAPGANDNASGVCAIIEIAKVLFNEKLEHSLQFVLFSGEEQGLLGSKNYAKCIKDNGINLYRLINLDMIGYPHLNSGTVIIERDNNPDPRHNTVKENDVKSMEFGEVMKEMTSYTDLQYQLDSMYDSDYEPFEEEGYIVIGAYDGSAETNNPHYHSSSDLPSLIDWSFLTSVTKLVLATVLKIALVKN